MPRALILSPQPWDGFQVSKHHYAQALAKAGWDVVFVGPPDPALPPGSLQFTKTNIPGIQSLSYRQWFPYKLKFHARWLFDWLMQRLARRIARECGSLDLVWDFDNAYQFRDLRAFGATQSLFHLVDDVSQHGLGDKRADHFFYLHHSFCTHAGGRPDPAYDLGHGLGRVHADAARSAAPLVARNSDSPVHVGYVGNLGSGWLDWEMLASMVDNHKTTRFTFWGPLPKDPPPALAGLLGHLRVTFPGLTQPRDIVAAAPGVDVWLVPFGPGGAINSHKVLEYLSTGKPVVMDWLEAYEGSPLVAMGAAPGDGSLPDVLANVLADLDHWSTAEQMQARRQYALTRTYDARIARVFDILGDRVPPLCVGRTEGTDAA